MKKKGAITLENNTLTINSIEKVKLDFESGKIKETDISKDEALLISVLYEVQLIELEDEIQKMKDEIEDYKKRMKKAIEFIKINKK